MATYIQGVTDYIPQIQPFQPDLNFYGNVLQTKQGRFDAATKKVNDLYGSLLYSPLSRDSNIQRRDEFFKIIDNDIKRISGLDLSLKQNEDQALMVFKGFTDDKYMLTDMVKTKNAYNELEKGENYKYCKDPAKCNGQYWEAGIKKLHYKMQEFKNVSDQESLNFQIGSYDPYFDWKKDASARAKELGYDVKRDTPDGKWIVRDSNGRLVEGGLYNLFTTLYGDDPRVSANYKTEAYVARKDYGASFKDTFGSQEGAEKEYVMKVINQGMNDTTQQLSDISDKYDQMSVKGIKLQKKLDNRTITAREREDLELINQQKPTLQLSKETLETRLAEIQNNIDANDLNGLTDRADLSAATTYKKRDLEALAKSLGQIKQSRTLEVNPYTKMYEEFGLKKSMAKYEAQLESQLINQRQQGAEDLEMIKQGRKPTRGKAEAELDPIIGHPMDGLPGTQAKDDTDNKAGGYNANKDAALSKFQTARDGSSQTLYKLFMAAKTATAGDGVNRNPGAKAFLEQFKDPDAVSKVGDIKAFENLIATKKLSSISLFDAFTKNSKAPGHDNDWAKNITGDPRTYGAVINQVAMANQAFNKISQKNEEVNKSIVDKITATRSEKNLPAYYAKNLLAKYGGDIDSKENFIAKAQKAALNEHKTAISTRELGNYYDDLVEQFYPLYNSAENTGFTQGQGLSGWGNTGGTPMVFNLDLVRKGESLNTTNVVNLTNAAHRDFANTKVVAGDMSEESFDQPNLPGVIDFVKWYVNEWKSPNSATGRNLTAIVSNVGGNKPNVGAVTYSGFDPAAVKEWEGSGNQKGPLFDKKVLEKGLTMFFDNTKVDNPFKKPMDDAEVVLRSTGIASDQGFDGSAGVIDYSLDGDEVTATYKLDVFNPETGKWDSPDLHTKAITFPISKLSQKRAEMNQALINIAAKNTADQNKYIQQHQSR